MQTSLFSTLPEGGRIKRSRRARPAADLYQLSSAQLQLAVFSTLGLPEQQDSLSLEQALGLNTHLSLYQVRSHQLPEGVEWGDWLILHPQLSPQDGDIILCLLEEELQLAQFHYHKGEASLIQHWPQLRSWSLSEHSDIRLLAVAVQRIHSLR